MSATSSSSSNFWPASPSVTSNYSLTRAPRFYNKSGLFQRAYRAQFTQEIFNAQPNVNISKTFIPYDPTVEAFPVYRPITPPAPEIVSPRPRYAYNPLPDIEGAIERFETATNNTGVTQHTAAEAPVTPAWKLPCPDTLDGIQGHVGIVEHGPKVYERNLYTPVGFSNATTNRNLMAEDATHYYPSHANRYVAVEDLEAQVALASAESIEEKLWKMYYLYKLF